MKDTAVATSVANQFRDETRRADGVQVPPNVPYRSSFGQNLER